MNPAREKLIIFIHPTLVRWRIASLNAREQVLATAVGALTFVVRRLGVLFAYFKRQGDRETALLWYRFTAYKLGGYVFRLHLLVADSVFSFNDRRAAFIDARNALKLKWYGPK